VITITLKDDDLLQLEMIDIDRDEREALAFIRERILPEVKKQQAAKMRSHLDGGKGSMF